MRIGNDVVDLLDPETPRRALHPRFDERVFTASEAAYITSSAHPHRNRWAYWAAKESAYKVAKKLDSTAVFSPVQFKVTLDPSGEGVVDHYNNRFSLLVEQTRRYVHAIAFSSPTGAQSARLFHPSTKRSSFYSAEIEKSKLFLCGSVRSNRIIKDRPDELSRFARQQAARAIGSLFGIRPKEIAIPVENGIPHVRTPGPELHVDLSLSHHGRYVAYAICYLMPTSSTSKTSIP